MQTEPENNNRARIPAAGEVVRLLAQKGLSVCAAESCTGGLIADSFVSVPGASDVFAGSCVTYKISAKARVLGLDERKIEEDGVVSAETAKAMALGALRVFGADFALSSTGYADKSDRADIPDGTIFVALASAVKGVEAVEKLCLKSGRNENRSAAANAAVELLLQRLRTI